MESPSPQPPSPAADETVSVEQFLKLLSESGLLSTDEVKTVVAGVPEPSRSNARSLSQELIRQQRLTPYQASMLLHGRSKGLVLGSYEVLDKIHCAHTPGKRRGPPCGCGTNRG